MIRNASLIVPRQRTIESCSQRLLSLDTKQRSKPRPPEPPATRERDPVAKDKKPQYIRPLGELRARQLIRRAHNNPPRILKTKTGQQLLRPDVLAKRLRDLCSKAKYDEAIEKLQNSPLDAQNVIVWDTVISALVSARQGNKAHELYLDMKRRGHHPSNRTYALVLKGFWFMDDWPQRTRQLEQVRKVYSAWKAYDGMVRTSGSDFSGAVHPMNFYMSILAEAGHWDEALEILSTAEAPYLPDSYSHTLLLRTALKGIRSATQDKDRLALVSISKEVWKLAEKNKCENDGVCVGTYLCILHHGTQSDQLRGFDIIRDYAGLAKPGDKVGAPRTQMTERLLSVILDYCLASHKHKLCLHFLRHYMENSPTILDQGHMAQGLAAYRHLASLGSLDESKHALDLLEWMTRRAALNENSRLKLRPRIQNYSQAFACFRLGEDWASALRAFELMTGVKPDAFADSSPSDPPEACKRAELSVLYSLCTIALATGSPANMRQCLRILCGANTEKLLEKVVTPRRRGPVSVAMNNSWKDNDTQERRNFYLYKTAEATLQLLKHALPKSTSKASKKDVDTYVVSEEEQAQWAELKKNATEYIEGARGILTSYTPIAEDKPLGSQRGLQATESRVDDALKDRYRK